MSAATLISVQEYLSTTYHPDLDYVEGRLLERNVGELSHSDVQSACLFYLRLHYKNFWSGVEARVQVKPTRFRVPDVAVAAGARPSARIFVAPPVLVIEVLSPDDRMSAMQEKIDDYLTFGIPHVWVVDPQRQRAHVYSENGIHEVKDGVLRAGEIEMPLSEIFG